MCGLTARILRALDVPRLMPSWRRHQKTSLLSFRRISIPCALLQATYEKATLRSFTFEVLGPTMGRENRLTAAWYSLCLYSVSLDKISHSVLYAAPSPHPIGFPPVAHNSTLSVKMSVVIQYYSYWSKYFKTGIYCSAASMKGIDLLLPAVAQIDWPRPTKPHTNTTSAPSHLLHPPYKICFSSRVHYAFTAQELKY